MNAPIYAPTDKQAVEAALILQRYCEVKSANGCAACIHNLGKIGCCGICDELPADYIIPERIVRKTGAKLPHEKEDNNAESHCD